jgi:hypothetical protein
MRCEKSSVLEFWVRFHAYSIIKKCALNNLDSWIFSDKKIYALELHTKYIYLNFRWSKIKNLHENNIGRLGFFLSYCIIFSYTLTPKPMYFSTQSYKAKVIYTFIVMSDTNIYTIFTGSSWPWSYGGWTYNCLCYQCLSSLMLWVRISIRARCTTLCDKVCQWLATGRWSSPSPPISSTNKTDRHDIT